MTPVVRAHAEGRDFLETGSYTSYVRPDSDMHLLSDATYNTRRTPSPPKYHTCVHRGNAYSPAQQTLLVYKLSDGADRRYRKINAGPSPEE